ncbi:MAG: hypothetical protein E2O92_11045 [Alphaproteobacteria bacterium]|nr:MAG: hypothetical protein E2O92_11045 [Alphaproteobacteria bacterium]
MSNIVRKSLVEADVFLDDGVLLRGGLYLAKEEVADDVVNHSDPFLLLNLDDGTRMVNKDTIAKIIVRGGQIKLRTDMVPHENVSLIMRNNETMEGVVLLKGFGRVSSQINDGGYFTPLLMSDGGVEYIRSSSIAQVVLDAKIATSAKDEPTLAGSESALRALL